MRRTAAMLLTPLIAAAAALAGCSSSSPSAARTANNTVTVTGSYGTAPKVKIPAAKAGSNLYIKTESKGTGPALPSTGGFLGNYVVYIWDGTKHKLALSTFSSTPEVLSTTLLPGLKKALVGQKMGSRILAVLPPKYGYGSHGNPQYGVSGSDTLVFVIDLIKSYPATASATGAQVSTGGGALPRVLATPGTAPQVTIPAGNPPATLSVTTLIKGTGRPVAKGDVVVAQYVGVNWRTKQVFDSSWQHGSPFGFQIGASPAQTIPGWDTGLLGQTVGSRVMLVIPPAEGYGANGNSSVGIKGTDTLVFVVDILDAIPQSTK